MTDIAFRPMPGKIAVRVDKDTLLTSGGLFLLRDPNNSRVGEVVAIYDPFKLDVDDEEMTEPYVSVGDIVVFGKHNGVEVMVQIGGNRASCIILKETEILTKVELIEEKADGQESK